MAKRREVLLMLGVGVAAAVAGVVAGPWLVNAPGDSEALRSARLADLDGKPRSLEEWRGRILVINFWATWCPPCREEIPGLVRARDKLLPSGVEFVGIAIDQVAKVREFARNVQISYPLLMADAAGLELIRKLGNPSGGLPFTVVLDRKGSIAHRNLGAVTQQKIEDQLGPMLAA
ncbi:MAG: TlpA family protein disulfide reductase [Proteobacteria bacterium]|nr:TlpA family protein disulfide reductase [Pseudomonadota bacterium]